MTGQIVPRSEAMELCFSAGLGHSSIGGSGRNNPLGSRGVRVLKKCSRKQIEVVATQTIQKMNKRLGKHFSYRR